MDKRTIISLLAVLLSLSLLSFSSAVGVVGGDDSETADDNTGLGANEDDEEALEDDESLAGEGTSPPPSDEKIISQSCGFFRHCPEGYGCFVFDGLGKRCGLPNPCSYFQCNDDKICEVRPPNLILGAPQVTCSEPESVCSRLERSACTRNTHCAWKETKCVPGDETVCPAVCVEMWEIKGNACILNECGSGCGPDNKKSFHSADECESALPNYCNGNGQCKAYFSHCSCSWQCAREAPAADCARACGEEDQEPAPACNCEGNKCAVIPPESCEGLSRAECKRNDACMWQKENWLRGTCVDKPTPPICGNNVCDKKVCVGDICYPPETPKSCPNDCRIAACPTIECAEPEPGCHYENPRKDENGCQINCGTVVCEPKCGNNICEEGEKDNCPVCIREPCNCMEGTCPRDCQTDPHPPGCTKEYVPVCGQPAKHVCCDGTSTGNTDANCERIRVDCSEPKPKTYSNLCLLKSDGATLLYRGECKTSPSCGNGICEEGEGRSFSTDGTCPKDCGESVTSNYRFASWQCYDGTAERQGGETSCKPYETWKQYAKDFCENKCSQEFEGKKCGVNTFKVEQECSDRNDNPQCPAVCVPVWEIKNGICTFNECGSGCGADNSKTFETRSGCELGHENDLLNCRDSDGGKTYSSKGTVTFNDGTSKTDKCWDDGKTLTEYVCIGGVYQGDHSYICPHGCSEGACLSASRDTNW